MATEKRSAAVAKSIRLLGWTTAALYFFFAVALVTLVVLRSHDLQVIVDRNTNTNHRQEAQLAYLCKQVTIIDLLVVQLRDSQQQQLKSLPLGTKEREFLRNRISILTVAHRELSDQRACKEVQ